MLLRGEAYSDEWLAAHVPIGRWGRPERGRRVRRAARRRRRRLLRRPGPVAQRRDRDLTRWAPSSQPAVRRRAPRVRPHPRGPDRSMTLRRDRLLLGRDEREPVLRHGRRDRAGARPRACGRRSSPSCSARACSSRSASPRSPASRSGLPTLTFTRAAFGPRGNIPNGVLTWAALVAFEAINCIFGVYALLALMAELGLGGPGRRGQGARDAARPRGVGADRDLRPRDAGVRQRVFAVALTRVLVLVLAYSIGGVDGRSTRERGPRRLGDGRAHPGGRCRGRLGPDLLPVQRARLRPLPAGRGPGRAIFWTVTLGSGLIALLLSVMGVLLASRGDMSDPIAGVEPFVPGLGVRPLHRRRGRRLDRQQRGRLLLVGAVPAVGRTAAAALAGDRARHRDLDGDRPVHPVRAGLHHGAPRLRGAHGGLARAVRRRLDHGRADAALALRPGGDPRRQPAQPLLGWHGFKPRAAGRAARRRRRVPADDERADFQGPVSECARGRRLHLDARPAGERCASTGRSRGAERAASGASSRRSSRARATAAARVSASSLR